MNKAEVAVMKKNSDITSGRNHIPSRTYPITHKMSAGQGLWTSEKVHIYSILYLMSFTHYSASFISGFAEMYMSTAVDKYTHSEHIDQGCQT